MIFRNGILAIFLLASTVLGSFLYFANSSGNIALYTGTNQQASLYCITLGAWFNDPDCDDTVVEYVPTPSPTTTINQYYVDGSDLPVQRVITESRPVTNTYYGVDRQYVDGQISDVRSEISKLPPSSVVYNTTTSGGSSSVSRDFLTRQVDVVYDSLGRSISNVSDSISDLTTTDIEEGSNLYYTDSRVASYLAGSSTLTTSLNYWTKSGSDLSYTGGNVGIGTSSPYAALSVVGVSGVVADHYTSTSTTNASVFPYASTTALTIAGRVYTSDATVSNTITLANLNGPLQAVNGLVSATTTISPAFGGTGVYTLPSYGSILVGQANGSYVLTATSSLGLSSFAYPFTPTTNYAVINQATTGIAWFQNGLNASSTSNFVYASTTALTVSGNAYFPGSGIWNSSGNVGVGTTTPDNKLTISSALSNNSQVSTQVIDSSTGQSAYLGIRKFGSGNSYGGVWFGASPGDGNYTLLGDSSNTFFNAPAGGTMFFRNNNANKMVIDSNGNVGIGTTSPNWKLSVSGMGYFGDNVISSYFTATSTTATSTFAGGLNVGSGGLVYDMFTGQTSINSLNIGAMSFYTNAGIVSWADMPVTSSASIGTVESYSAQLGGTSILTVYGESDGAGSVQNTRIGVGTSTPWKTFSVTGTVGFDGLTSSAVGNAVCITANKEITTASAAVCNGVSSERFKHDIVSSDQGLSTILSLRPVSFKYNQGYGDNGLVSQYGFIAEEVNKIDPRLVILGTDGLPNTVRYDFIAPILTKAIQEQQVQISALASSTPDSVANTLASSTPVFIERIAIAVKELISSAGDWVLSKITATLAIFKNVETETIKTQTASITNGLEMTDSASGNVYCVRITNGDFVKTLGVCDATTTPPPTHTQETNTTTSTESVTSTTTDMVHDTSSGGESNTVSTTTASSTSSTSSTEPEVVTETIAPEPVEATESAEETPTIETPAPTQETTTETPSPETAPTPETTNETPSPEPTTVN